MLVCCCWNQGASFRLRFRNMKGFVGWAGGLALIQGLIAREAGNKLRLWDRERNLVTYSSKDRSSKQTKATGCWANHSVCIQPSLPPLLLLLLCWPGSLSHLSEPQRRLRGGGNNGVQECKGSGPKLKNKALLSCRDPASCRAEDAGSTLSYLEREFSIQSRLCVVLLQPLKLLKLTIYLW